MTFDVEPHTITCLIGPNGAGKTTVFNLISGLLQPSAGQILFRRERIDSLSPHDIARRGIGRTFQDPRVFTGLNVVENILAGMHLRAENPLWAMVRDRRTRGEWNAATERAMALLDQVGLAERHREPSGDLSFGEQRFLSIARTLAADPELLLLDEPTVGLDGPTISRLLELLGKLVRDDGKTILLVEHNMDVVLSFSDRIHLLVQGELVASEAPEEMRRHPKMIEAYLGVTHALAGA